MVIAQYIFDQNTALLVLFNKISHQIRLFSVATSKNKIKSTKVT